MRTHTRAALAAATALTLALTTAACAPDDASSDADSSTDISATDSASSAEAAGIVTFGDGWAKATTGEMSGVFGTVRNPGDADLQLTGVSGDLDGTTELHETVPGGSGMTMRQKEDGFPIPAGGELILEPGGNHIMLMDLAAPISAGQEITLTLEFSDGAEQDVTVSARDFMGGEEEYVGGGHGGTGHGGMSHDG